MFALEFQRANDKKSRLYVLDEKPVLEDLLLFASKSKNGKVFIITLDINNNIVEKTEIKK